MCWTTWQPSRFPQVDRSCLMFDFCLSSRFPSIGMVQLALARAPGKDCCSITASDFRCGSWGSTQAVLRDGDGCQFGLINWVWSSCYRRCVEGNIWATDCYHTFCLFSQLFLYPFHVPFCTCNLSGIHSFKYTQAKTCLVLSFGSNWIVITLVGWLAALLAFRGFAWHFFF